MITLHEGNGGFTIEVKNGKHIRRFECASYIVIRRGIPWFDLDAAMRDAKKYDKQHSKTKRSR